MPTLHIQLLGDFLLRLDDRPIATFELPRLQALFTYLVLHRDAPQQVHHLRLPRLGFERPPLQGAERLVDAHQIRAALEARGHQAGTEGPRGSRAST